MSESERHLGTQLFARTSRRIALTEAGTAFAAASLSILDRVEEAERSAAGEYNEPRGELAITAPTVFGQRHVLPLALEFLSAHRKIDLRISMDDRHLSLIEEHVDVGVRIGHLEDSGLKAVRVGEVRRVICASPAYLAVRGVPTRPEELRAHDGISFRNFAAGPEWRYCGDNDALSVQPRTRLAVNATEAAIAAAVAGVGIARVLSYQIVDELRSGVLVAVLESFAPDPIPVQLVYAAQGVLPVKTRAFLDWIVPRLRSRLLVLAGDETGRSARADRV